MEEQCHCGFAIPLLRHKHAKTNRACFGFASVALCLTTARGWSTARCGKTIKMKVTVGLPHCCVGGSKTKRDAKAKRTMLDKGGATDHYEVQSWCVLEWTNCKCATFTGQKCGNACATWMDAMRGTEWVIVRCRALTQWSAMEPATKRRASSSQQNCMPGRRHRKEISQVNADDDFAMVVTWLACVHDRTRRRTWVVAATTRRPNH